MTKYSFYEISQLVKDGRLEEIQNVSREIGHNATINRDKWSLLHLSSSNDRVDVIHYLIETGHNINCRDKNGKSPLYYCISEKAAKMLIDAGAEVNQKSILGKTPLHHACLSTATPAVVKLLLQSDGQVNAQDKFGNTPLLNACDMAYGCIDEEEFQQNLPKLEILLEHGADVAHTNLKGETSLHICSLRHTHEIAEIMLKHGVNVNAVNKKHQTALTLSCYNSISYVYGKKGIIATLDHLLTHGADPTVADEIGMTPLHVLLLNHCSSMSAIDIAPIVSMLLEHGASLNAKDNMLRTPVHYACYAAAGYTNWIDILTMFLSYGGDINAQDVEGFAPIHLTVPRDCSHSSSFLSVPWDLLCETDDVRVEKKINWNCARKQGVTLAHIVSAQNGIKFAGYKIPWDINAPDEFLSTPLHYAAFTNNTKVLKYLDVTGYDAKVTLQNCLGEDPIESAMVAWHLEMVALLSEIYRETYLKEVEWLSDNSCEPCIELANKSRTFYGPFEKKEQLVSVDPTEIQINPVGKMEHYLPHIFHTPMLGKVLETAEVGQIHHETESLIKQILQKVADHDCRFRSVIIPSGSVREETKAGLPDEYDFMCNLEHISSSCKVVEDDTCSPGFVRFKVIEDGKHMDEFLDAEGFLVPSLVKWKFEEIVKLVMFDSDLWRSCRICSNFVVPSSELNPAYPKPSVILSFCWNGPVYKNMVYSVDLVPVIDAGAFWPMGAVKRSPLLDTIENQCLFTMTIPRFEHGIFGNEVRISFSLMESAIFDTIPGVIRDAYITAKAVRNVIPTLVESEEVRFSDEDVYSAQSLICSYWLKNALFHELEKHGLDDSCSLTVWVRRIYERVHRYVCEDEVFPSFFMPQLDFIATKLKNRDKTSTSLESLIREFTACKKTCQIIQQFLSSDGESASF